MKEIKRIPLEGLPNTRDLGGFETTDGRHIRPHRLIRSGQLIDMTETDKKVLTQEYQLKTIVDFRTDKEREESPDPSLPGVTHIANPILRDLAVGITRDRQAFSDMIALLKKQLEDGTDAAAEYMTGMYRNFVRDSYARAQFCRFFDILLTQEEGALLWHCSAGKDRAGTGCALLLWALGVPEDTIYADYLLVNELAREEVERQLDKLDAWLKDPQLKDCMRSLMCVRKEYLGGVFQEICEKYGSVDSYLEQEMGLDAQRKERLRSLYLE